MSRLTRRRKRYRVHIEERDGLGETAEVYLTEAEADAVRYVADLLPTLTIEEAV
ncbi:hypothetical protein DER29_0504 [Micromonospora sp. M71_S20]|uniref:hypothetical protein n=1 Tax=Micromonospora sp. M71_S20 TaxID=592872 RepID=UPI000F2B8E3A|nr:hypothetical protein [Micromonospora sp. M71_S20]RLK22665.1 hypothetical protein DER29_0504 [Micromonospora sp. M71_S20]